MHEVNLALKTANIMTGCHGNLAPQQRGSCSSISQLRPGAGAEGIGNVLLFGESAIPHPVPVSSMPKPREPSPQPVHQTGIKLIFNGF